MLTVRGRASVGAVIGSVALATVAVLGLPAGVAVGSDPTPSPTSGPVNCPPEEIDPTTQHCTVDVSSPGSTASTSTTSKPAGGSKVGAPVCHYLTVEVSCGDKDLGWYDPNASCYYKLVDPQPPATDQIWLGRPAGGAIYTGRCFGLVPVGTLPGELTPIGEVWLPKPPPNDPVRTPGQLAAEAEALLTLHSPTIGIAPKPGGSGLVGMPVWLWIDTTVPDTWGTQSQTAAVPGLSVTATATAESITWDMGDGHQVTFQNPGKAYDPSYGLTPSPDSGYTYTQPSGGQPGGVYTVTATVTWKVTWAASNGQTGTLSPVTAPPSTVAVKIGELQAVNG